MSETEEEEHNIISDANNVTMDAFYQSPVTTNTQGKIANVPNERQISSDILAETIKGFNGFTLQSTINDSAYYYSEENDAEIDPKSDQLVATHTSDGKKRKVTDADTTDGKFSKKSLINRIIPEIIPVIILSVNPPITDGVAENGRNLHAHQIITSRENRYGRGAQRCTCFPISYGGKLEEHGRDDSMGWKHLRNPPHIMRSL